MSHASHSTEGNGTPIRVCGVLVTFRPDPESFRTALRAVLPQLDGLIVVDNSPNASDQAEVRRIVMESSGPGPTARPEVMTLGENVGLSRGINLGLRRASGAGFTVFLLLDQDSAPAAGAVEVLRREYARRSPNNVPFLLAAENDLPNATALHCLIDSVLYRYRSGTPRVRPAPLAITSGLLLDTQVLRRVGLLDESIFVDSADHEFCFRAGRHGVRLYTVPGARILHRLGSGDARAGTFLGQPYRYSTEERLYYGIRDMARTSRRYWLDHPLVNSTLLALGAVRTLAYRAGGPPRRSLYLAARKGWVDALGHPDRIAVPGFEAG